MRVLDKSWSRRLVLLSGAVAGAAVLALGANGIGTASSAPPGPAQAPPAPGGQTAADPTSALRPLPPPASDGEGVEALKVTGLCGTKSGPGRAALYATEPVKVRVTGLQKWLRKSENDVSALVVYFDGRPVPGLPVRLVGSRKQDQDDTCWGKDAGKNANKAGAGGDEDVLVFDLQRSKESNKVWRVLLARPDEWNFRRTFKVGVGGKGTPNGTAGAALDLAVVSLPWAAGFLFIFLAGLALLFVAGRRTNMLRDTTGAVPADGRRPFSLGRCQMAFWFFLVVAAYLLIYLVTGDHHGLTTSALWLIGISAATGLGSIAIDVINTKPGGAAAGAPAGAPVAPPAGAAPPAPAAPAPAPAPAAPPAAAVPALAPGAPGAGAAAAVQTAARAIVARSTFFQDLFGTDGGDSLHRLQIVVWTVVLGLIFVVSVWEELAMPEFSTEVLALMGLSGGTYVGFKLKEAPK